MAQTAPKKPDQLLPVGLLDTPINANFWVSGFCNFACRYCLHALPEDAPAKRGIIRKLLAWEDFELFCEGLRQFPRGVLSASFCGIGEPLTHPRLPEMIARLKRDGAVRAVEVTTNGSLLTDELSARLIEAGVDYLAVSVQGADEEAYKAACGVAVDARELAERVGWFHRHKKAGAIVQVKTLDVALPNPGDEARFHQLFDGVSDIATVAHAVRLFQGMDYSSVVPEQVDQYLGGPVAYSGHCPLVFSTLHLLPDGGISPCPLPERPLLLGNIREKTLVEAWNSRERLELLLSHARGRRDQFPACRECVEPDMLVGDTSVPDGLVEALESALASR